jgi:hypothetical protein
MLVANLDQSVQEAGISFAVLRGSAVQQPLSGSMCSGEMILEHPQQLVGVTGILPVALQDSDRDHLARDRLLALADRFLSPGQRLRASICRG